MLLSRNLAAIVTFCVITTCMGGAAAAQRGDSTLKVPAAADIVAQYINYGAGATGGQPNCNAWASIFAPNATMLSPLGAGPTGLVDVTDPKAVCRYMSSCFSKVYGSADRIISEEYSASIQRHTVSWTLTGLTQKTGKLVSIPASTTLWIESGLINSPILDPTAGAAGAVDAFDSGGLLGGYGPSCNDE